MPVVDDRLHPRRASELTFNAGLYRLAEISMWSMVRQPYQIVDDMFGRLIPTNEPFLVIYLSGSFQVQEINAPILPMNKFIDNIGVSNSVASTDLAFSHASLDLAGCPAVGRCGPLITPNLYTPPGVALTVCDTVPSLTTYSVTLNTLTATLAGEINEAYVYIKDDVLTLYAGKKIGDLVLSWVSQEQGDVQLIGYIEGAPPAPMANLTNKASYAGATSLTVSAPTSVTLKLLRGSDTSNENKIDLSLALGGQFKLGTHIAPFGLGVSAQEVVFSLLASLGGGFSYTWSSGDSSQITASNKLDESNKYTVKLQGTLAPVTGDQFMANLNSTTTQSTTVGTAASKCAILPNPNLGGFTTSNPPAALPRTPADEKFGARMYVPSPYGQAFVTSQTLDVYQQTLLQTNTVYGFVRIPNTQIPRDLNIVVVPDEQPVPAPRRARRRDRLRLQSGDAAQRRADVRDVDRRDGGVPRQELLARHRRTRRELHADRGSIQAQAADRSTGIQCAGALSIAVQRRKPGPLTRG